MYKIGKQFSFEAAHHLPKHLGQCQRLHGHSYLIETVLEGGHLQAEGSSEGMLVDFGDLSKAMRAILSILDHSDLNESMGVLARRYMELEGVELLVPTAECLAWLIFRALGSELGSSSSCRLKSVRVWETRTSWAEYVG